MGTSRTYMWQLFGSCSRSSTRSWNICANLEVLRVLTADVKQCAKMLGLLVMSYDINLPCVCNDKCRA